jgi:hypothetical protein
MQKRGVRGPGRSPGSGLRQPFGALEVSKAANAWRNLAPGRDVPAKLNQLAGRAVEIIPKGQDGLASGCKQVQKENICPRRFRLRGQFFSRS